MAFATAFEDTSSTCLLGKPHNASDTSLPSSSSVCSSVRYQASCFDSNTVFPKLYGEKLDDKAIADGLAKEMKTLCVEFCAMLSSLYKIQKKHGDNYPTLLWKLSVFKKWMQDVLSEEGESPCLLVRICRVDSQRLAHNEWYQTIKDEPAKSEFKNRTGKDPWKVQVFSMRIRRHLEGIVYHAALINSRKSSKLEWDAKCSGSTEMVMLGMDYVLEYYSKKSLDRLVDFWERKTKAERFYNQKYDGQVELSSEEVVFKEKVSRFLKGWLKKHDTVESKVFSARLLRAAELYRKVLIREQWKTLEIYKIRPKDVRGPELDFEFIFYICPFDSECCDEEFFPGATGWYEHMFETHNWRSEYGHVDQSNDECRMHGGPNGQFVARRHYTIARAPIDSLFHAISRGLEEPRCPVCKRTLDEVRRSDEGIATKLTNKVQNAVASIPRSPVERPTRSAPDAFGHIEKHFQDLFQHAVEFQIKATILSAPPIDKSKQTHLFALPLEIRLMIYSHCTAVSLLRLASSSSQLKTEVNAYPSIFTNAPGYWPYWPSTDKEGLRLINIGEKLEMEVGDKYSARRTVSLVANTTFSWEYRGRGWLERTTHGRRFLEKKRGLKLRDWAWEATKDMPAGRKGGKLWPAPGGGSYRRRGVRK
ncbi:hypothetical protein BJ508DRAFT_361283 [Ascobolus immersus RN42]|uniref:F-box domain-containing protein n=1 Tax=Ascobolus immersus RN42 TaxID=1160509 RepID=A0A3N4IL53_ASCIM|nr:hypothetical protein BJ508DRAFT_361283 [Ascobolus immersus RN42]